jgi:hypothetical protein
MPTPQQLLDRLDEIAVSLEQTGHALALLALGSVGLELDRLDQYSDLDFFAIIEDGWKNHFIQNLDWLERLHPVAYSFQNTPDGHKLLYADGIFCEFAVFELKELGEAAYPPARIVWKLPDVSAEIAIPHRPIPDRSNHAPEWLLGEALTNLYVGLCRYQRGEKLIAQRFIEHYTVDRLLELASLVEAPQTGETDLFSDARRFERRFPQMAAHLGEFIQGYNYLPLSAQAILHYLTEHFSVPEAIRSAILERCQNQDFPE